MPHPVDERPTRAPAQPRPYGARKENRHKRPGARVALPVSISYTEQVVAALDNESDSGMGLVFLLEPPFRVGQRIRMRYQGAPRSGVVKHITLSEGQFFVGVEWDDQPQASPRRPSRDRR